MKSALNVLLIDNYDSFTFNLAEEFESRNCQVEVWRNNVSAERALQIIGEREGPKLIVISPGPGTPAEAGSSIELVQKSEGKVPIFGVCLGHQAIVEAFGGVVGRAESVRHGKMSNLEHQGKSIFAGLPERLSVARYHSLAATKMPDCLEVTAYCDRVVMALRHREWPIIGVQFHPESILTTEGGHLIENVLAWAKKRRGA